MKKLPIAISKFDLCYIIAFVVVALIGGGAWWYLSGALQQAQQDVSNAKSSFDRYSKDTKYDVVVNAGNLKVLQQNIDILKGQLEPIIPDKLQSKDNKLKSIPKEDPVAWKHELDDNVHSLTAAAKSHQVKIPENFYFGFSRYLSQSPGDEQTEVLSKQLIGVEQLATILVSAPVRSIARIRRTYEEDPHPANPNTAFNTQSFFSGAGESDKLDGFATNVNGLYVSYPFEVTFDTDAENLRTIVNNLVKSPYVFVIRAMVVKDSKPTSPQLHALDDIVGSNSAGNSSVVGSAPGEVAATTSSLGPQYLFGDSHLTVTIRIDMIEWKGPSQ